VSELSSEYLFLGRESADFGLRMSEVVRRVSNMSSNQTMTVEALGDALVLGLSDRDLVGRFTSVRQQAAQVHAAEVQSAAASPPTSARSRGVNVGTRAAP